MKIFPYEFVVFRKLWKPVGLHAFYIISVNIPSTKTLNWQYVCYLLLLLLFILTHFNSCVTTRGLSVADFLYSSAIVR